MSLDALKEEYAAASLAVEKANQHRSHLNRSISLAVRASDGKQEDVDALRSMFSEWRAADRAYADARGPYDRLWYLVAKASGCEFKDAESEAEAAKAAGMA